MGFNFAFPVDKLLSDALRTVEQLSVGTRFVVQDLLPPAIWRDLPLTPVRTNLGRAFGMEAESRSDIRAVGSNGEQAVYEKIQG